MHSIRSSSPRLDPNVPISKGREKPASPSTSPLSRNKSLPYSIPQRIVPLELSYTQRALGDSRLRPYYPRDAGTEPCKCQDRLNDIIKDLPIDVVHDAIRAQYADCEVTRHRVLTASWEIERLERWKSFHTRSLEFFQKQNATSLGKLEFWRSWCTIQGIDVRSQDEEATRNLWEDESSALEHLQMHFRCSEDTAVSLGAISVDQAITNEEASDMEVSNDSNLEVSGTGTLQRPYASDLEEPCTSHPEDLFRSEGSNSS